MAETFANLTDLTKEVWTQDRCERQFYNKRLWLDRIEKTNRHTIGRQAQVPVETSLPGGSSTLSVAGGALNAADKLRVDRADYTLSYLYEQVEIEIGAMNQADGPGQLSTVDAVDQNIESTLDAMRVNANRQALGNGDALIAETTTSTTTTLNLLATGYGYDAIVRGWLRPGLTIDVGTAGAETSVAADRIIQSVTESPTAPSVVVSGANVTAAASGEYVSIANSRAAAVSNEMSGLRTIAGSLTSTIGTLAGSSFAWWQPAHVDTTTTVSSLDLCLTLQRKVFQKMGKWPTFVTTSIKQYSDLYSQYESQVRFASDASTAAGNVDGFKWNGLEVVADPDIPDRELYMLTLDNFLVVTGAEISKPTWVSDIEGSGGRLRWKQGYTSFVDALAYSLQVAINRRNSHAAAIGLTG